MSDPRLLVPTRYTYPAGLIPPDPQTVEAQSKDGLVHAVKTISDSYHTGWELGQWRMLSLYCGQIMKHHPKKLDRSVGSTTADRAVTCLGCVAAYGRRRPVHCLKCHAERGVAIPEHCPHR